MKHEETLIHMHKLVKDKGVCELIDILDMSDTLIIAAIINSPMREAVISRYYEKFTDEIDQIYFDNYESRKAKAEIKADLGRVGG